MSSHYTTPAWLHLFTNQTLLPRSSPTTSPKTYPHLHLPSLYLPLTFHRASRGPIRIGVAPCACFCGFKAQRSSWEVRGVLRI